MDSEVVLTETTQPVILEKAKGKGSYSSGCQDIYQQVYDRVMSEGGPKLKAILYARVAAQNCETKGEGD